MGLTVNLTGTGRCGNAVPSPRQAIPPAAWPVDKGGFVVCWLQRSSRCFVIAGVNSDQLRSDCNLDGHVFIFIVGLRKLDFKRMRFIEQKSHLRPPSPGGCLEAELEFYCHWLCSRQPRLGEGGLLARPQGCRSAACAPENFQGAGGASGFYLLIWAGARRSCPNVVVSGSALSWQPVCTSISAPLAVCPFSLVPTEGNAC